MVEKGMELKGTRTEANLMAAFSGESMARNKYDFYAKAARKEGLTEVAEIFEETAKNEQAHAKLWFRILDKLGDTEKNLRDAQAGEHFEWTDMYARFEKEAHEEGFERIAALFKMVGHIEKMHDKRYGVYIAQMERDLLLKRGQNIRWLCTVCGHVHDGTEPPEKCPVCGHGRGHFKAAEKITEV